MKFVYKILETVNNFYLYLISHIDDVDLVQEHYEHYCFNHPEQKENEYFNLIGWDKIDTQKIDNIKPIDIINNTLPIDEKCINNSEKYKEFIIIPEKKTKKEKVKVIKENVSKPKKEPKPKKESKPKAKKAKESTVKIDLVNTKLDLIN